MSVDIAPTGAEFGYMDMFNQADIVVKSVMILLVIFSLISWKVIVSKYLHLSILRLKIARFEDKVWGEFGPNGIYERIKHSAGNIIKKVFVAGMYELDEANKSKKSTNKESVREKCFITMESTKNREIIELKKGLGMLATISSSSPFIGLFGTVWGIMNSFSAIAVSGNTSLAVVAPGIAEALLATAIGLFAAIPALIFYNKFNLDVNNISKRVDCFIDDMSIHISEELEK